MLARYAKALAAVLVAIATAVVAALTDSAFTAQEGVIVAGVGVSAVGVAIVPNLTAGPAAYAKAAVAFLGAGLGALAVLMVGGLTLAEVLEALIAAAGAVGVVAAVPNRDALIFPLDRGGVLSTRQPDQLLPFGESGHEQTHLPGGHVVPVDSVRPSTRPPLPDTGR